MVSLKSSHLERKLFWKSSETTSFELLSLNILYFQKQQFKQLLWKFFTSNYIHILENLHSLDNIRQYQFYFGQLQY